ncbi:MAG TPA: amidohydrolase family protein [Actinomycetota bacterium]|nr:amidohydrolase family protein [Actinomycetota bacterium]
MSTLRVDAHHHLWDPGRRAYPWMDESVAAIRRPFGVADLDAAAGPEGFEATIAVQAVSSLEETEELLDVAATSGRVAGVVGWVDLADPEVAATLAALRDRPGGRALVGVRHQVHDEPDPDWLLRDRVLDGLAAVAAAGLVYDLLVRERELPAARVVAERLPELTLVVDHLAKPRIREGAMEPWAGDLAALARHPNVACKVSGLVTEADWTAWTPAQLVPYVAHAAEVFGPERLLFGSDWPVCLLAAGYAEVVAAASEALDRAGFGRAEREAVFGANAHRLYRLP